MSIEPHQVRTVCIRPVLPPKPEAKLRVPLSEAFYAELIAKDAEAVRSRFRNKWGNLSAKTSGESANQRRKAESDARRDALAERTIPLLAEGQMAFGELRDRLMVSENQMRNALGYLRKQGRADFFRIGSGSVWRIQEAAE